MNKLDRAIEHLRSEYEKALALKYVRKPLAYALYQTWSYYDRQEIKRRVKDA